ncbi:zinc finger BED domain-containing protein RICESLEEPER 2-like protein [Tanacetum coccineum]
MLNPDPVVSGMVKDMKMKFDKYWKTYTMVLSFGAILDPLYKLNIIEFYLSKLGMDGPLLIEKVQSVEDGLRKLYNAYEIQPNVMQGSTKGPSLNVGGGKLCDGVEDDLAGFETFQSQYKKLEIVLICIYEDEVDEKELIDEDIEKLVKSSSDHWWWWQQHLRYVQLRRIKKIKRRVTMTWDSRSLIRNYVMIQLSRLLENVVVPADVVACVSLLAYLVSFVFGFQYIVFFLIRN